MSLLSTVQSWSQVSYLTTLDIEVQAVGEVSAHTGRAITLLPVSSVEEEGLCWQEVASMELSEATIWHQKSMEA